MHEARSNGDYFEQILYTLSLAICMEGWYSLISGSFLHFHFHFHFHSHFHVFCLFAGVWE